MKFLCDALVCFETLNRVKFIKHVNEMMLNLVLKYDAHKLNKRQGMLS